MTLRMPQSCLPAELWAVYRIYSILSGFSACSVTWFTCAGALTYFGSLHLVSAHCECLQTEIDEHLSQAPLTPGINATARSHVTRPITSRSHDFQRFLRSHCAYCLSCVPLSVADILTCQNAFRASGILLWFALRQTEQWQKVRCHISPNYLCADFQQKIKK